jgi:hypothetical protein
MILFTSPLMGVCQQTSPGIQPDAEIIRLREEIKTLERVTPPPGMEAQHRSFLDDKRIRLHALLQQQRDALVTYLESVRKLIPAADVQRVENEIRDKEKEMQDVKEMLRSSLAGSGTVPPAPARTTSPNATQAPNSSSTAPAPQTTQPPSGTPNTVPPQSVPPVAQPTATTSDITPLPVANAASAIASTIEASQGKTVLHDCSVVNTTSTFSKYEQAICDLTSHIQGRKKGHSDPEPAFNVPAKPNATISRNADLLELQTILAAKLIGKEERGKFLLEAEEARTDKQVGGGPTNSGSTSLVVKGGAPAALGFAVENGALLQSRSGTTLTFRGNPIGIIRLLGNKGFDTSFIEDDKDPVTRFLRKTSFSVSFDTSRGKQPGVFTADAQQLSGYSARIEFFNQRDPRHPKYQKDWAKFLSEEGVNFTQAIADTYHALMAPPTPSTPFEKKFKDPRLEGWLVETETLIAAAAPDRVEGIIKSQLDKFPQLDQLNAETRSALDTFAKSFSGYLTARKKLLDKIAKGSILSFEYTNNRPGNAPKTSNFNFIAATGTGRRIDLTANGSLTIFDKSPSAASLMSTRPGRIRDFQFAGQIDVPFGNVSQSGQFDWWASFRYERLLTDAATQVGTIAPNTKGDIFLLQSGLKIPIKGLGIQFPVSVTYANRTELIKEKEVRGNFGFTFDWNILWAKLKPF